MQMYKNVQELPRTTGWKKIIFFHVNIKPGTNISYMKSEREGGKEKQVPGWGELGYTLNSEISYMILNYDSFPGAPV